MKENVAEFMSKPEMQRIIRELAADSRNIVYTGHGKESKHRRKLTSRQIQNVLLKGSIVEGPYYDTLHGNWACRVERRSGEAVPVAYDPPSKLIIITAF